MTSPLTIFYPQGESLRRWLRADGVLPTPPPPAVVARFPGDPNPKVSGKLFWGASIKGNGSTTPHESAAGVPLAIHRTYWSSAQWVPSGGDSALLTQVRADHTSGCLPWVSFKIDDWAAAASGSNDAQFDALIAVLESYAKPTWLILNHEPENDGKSATDWRGMQARFRTRMNAYGAAHGGIHRLSFGSCLMAFTWNTTSGRIPTDWWAGAGVHDWIGADHYTEATASIVRQQLTSFLSFCAAHNVPATIPEWGLRAADAAAASKMAGFYETLLDGAHDVIGLSYFDSDLNSTGAGWQLTDTNGLLDAFHTLMQDPRSLHLSDLGY